MPTLSQAETEEIARRAAKHAVDDVMIRLGLDIEDAAETRKDMVHLREWRATCDTIKNRGLVAVFVAMVTTVLALLWLGFKHSLK